jgi:hypothetical protein
VVYEAAGDSEGRDGKPSHTEWTGKFDGKNYHSPAIRAQTRGRTRINDRTLELANKMVGKPVISGRIVVSPDGKSRTIHLTVTDSAGKKITATVVYDKQ